MATIKKGKILRGDIDHWDGVSKTSTRVSSSGGTTTGLKIGDTVDVLQVYGGGTEYTAATINTALARVATQNVSFTFSPGTWVIGANVTIPSTIACVVPAGCIFSVSSGFTLTFNGHVFRESLTWTSGGGTVTTTLGAYGLISDPAQGDSLIGVLRPEANAEATTQDVVNSTRPIQLGADFGASLSLTNGTDDWTTVLDNAILTGREIYIPKNAVLSVTGLTGGTACRIFGRGKIKLANASNVPIINVTVNDFEIEGVELDGNKANQTATTEATGAGIYVAQNVDNLKVKYCHIHDTKKSGVAGYGDHQYWNVSRNRIDDVGFIGIYPSQGSGFPNEHSIFSHNIIKSPGQDGIGTVAMQHCSIVGNTVITPVIAGIVLEARCDNTTVTGNTIVGDAADGPTGTNTGIQVNDGRGNTISGNTVTKCGNGISVGGSSTSEDVTITGNTIEDCGYSSAGIALDSSNSVSYSNPYYYGVTCTGNTIRDSYHAGIYINTIGGAEVSGNTIIDFNLDADTTTNRSMGGIVTRNHAYKNRICNNTIKDATGGNYKVGILEVGDGSNIPYYNVIEDNHIIGLTFDVLVHPHGTTASIVKHPTWYNAAPTTGSWKIGQRVYDPSPSASGTMGNVCTDGGDFGATSTTGSGTATEFTVTLASSAGLHDGMRITIAGAGTASADLDAYIVTINRSTEVATLNTAIVTTVSGAAVTLKNPTFKTFGAITA